MDALAAQPLGADDVKITIYLMAVQVWFESRPLLTGGRY